MSLLKIILLALICFTFPLTSQEELYTFNTEQVQFHETIPALAEASAEELLAEPSLKAADVRFAYQVGGPITRDILAYFQNLLGEEYENLRIDTKVQKFERNSYSNTPGWHADFFSQTDEQEDLLVRTNPGLEDKIKIFLLVSGEPATEFMVTRNMTLQVNVPTWKHLSQRLDTQVRAEDLYRIPIARPVELQGNELHRVTLYQGEEPTVRYFMRVYLFPKGHTEFGKFSNELFNWETHAQDLIPILGDVTDFLDTAFGHLNELGLDVTPYEMTHLCYRVATEEEFVQKKQALLQVGDLINDKEVGGRPYLVVKLHQPIKYQQFTVSLIAMPYPKQDNHYQTGLQHVAFLVREDLSQWMHSLAHVPFETVELQRSEHPELRLTFDDLVVKFHPLSLEELQ